MSCKYNYKGKEYTESELIKVLSKDPEIISSYGPQEERFGYGFGLDYTREDLKSFNAKIEHLKKAMDVEVVLDPNVPTSRVLGKNDSRTKEAGKPVILINPSAIFKTTAIHEFAHIFVDSFPKGLNNPRIQRALGQLKGTKIEAGVHEMYPDLDKDMLAKEVLATAIGLEGSEIWDDTSNPSKFEAFKNWFFDYLRRTFGLERNSVRVLAQDLISGKVEKDVIRNLSEEKQEQRHERSFTAEQKEFNKKEKSIDRVYAETLNRVLLVHESLKPTTQEAKQKQEQRSKLKKTTRFSSISELKAALEKYQEADQRKGLVKYIRWVSGEVRFMQKTLDERKAADLVTDANLIKSIDWNNTFSMIEDIQNLLETMYRDGEVTTKEREFFSEQLAEVQKERSKIETSLLEMSRESYAQLMADNDNKIYERFKAGYKTEYNDLINTSGPQNQTEEEYVSAKMNDNKEEMRMLAYEESLALAERSLSDLKWVAGNLFSEKNANSRDIQVLSKLVDQRELAIGEFAQSEASKFDKWNKEYRADIGSEINQKTKYDGMFEVSESGQHYFTSEYSPEFFEEKRRESQKAHNADWYNEEYKDTVVNRATLQYEHKGNKRKLGFENAKSINIAEVQTEGATAMHVTYTKGDKKYEISMEEAIAKSEYKAWSNENTVDSFTGSTRIRIPAPKWKSKEYTKLSPEKKRHLGFLKGKIRQADLLYGGQKTLVKKGNGQEWMKLPSVMKSDVSRISEGQGKSFFKHKFSAAIETQKDEFDEGNRDDTGDISNEVKVFADVTNREKLRVPIAFRAKLDAKDQSLDLHSIVLMNLVNGMNHQEKTDLESTFLVVLDVMKNRSSPEHTGLGKLKKVHALTGKTVYKDGRDGLSNETKKAMDILENRIYGIKNKESGKIAGVQVHKAAQSWLKYSGTIALLGNYANSIINLNMGTLSNVMEAIGGETYNLKDWKDAGVDYWKDMKNIMNDMGSNVVTSRTNLFMNTFNVMGGKEYIESRFEETTRFQTLMKANSMRPIAKMGEHMMQAKVMYAVLKSIKAMNTKGQYLNAAGKVVKTKKEAAGLDKMISFEKLRDGSTKMVLNSKVTATSFTSEGGRDQILLETRNLIKHKVIELHGLYDSDLQSAMQRNFMGKLAFFLRKWMIPGSLRRWRGLTSSHKDVNELTEVQEFYSQDAKANLEGYYTTAARFILNTIPKAIKEMDIAIIKTRVSEMTPREKSNIKKMITEIAMITALWAAYLAVDDEDDDEKRVFAKYILRRQISELSFFLNPAESFKIASTPTAAIGTVKNILQLSVQLMPNNFTEKYEQGPYKDQNKALRKAKQLVPLMNLKGKEEFKNGLKFLNNMSL